MLLFNSRLICKNIVHIFHVVVLALLLTIFSHNSSWAQQGSAAFPNETCASLAANPVIATLSQGSGQGAFNVKNLTSFEMQPGDTVVFTAINPIDNNPSTGDPRWRLSKTGQGPGNGFLVGANGNPNNTGNFEQVVATPVAAFQNTTNGVINTSFSAQIFVGPPQDPKDSSFQLVCSCIPGPPQTGSLTVTKTVNGTDKSFVFNGTAPFGAFNLSNGQSNFQGNLTPGSFTITETVDPAYTLDSIACVGNGAPEVVTLANGEVVVDVAAGEDVVCTFTNSEIPVVNTGSLTIIKTVNGTDKSFVFNGTAPFGMFNLSNGQSNFQGNLTPGTFTVTETLDAAYTLDSVACVGNAAAEMVTLGTGELVVDVAATEDVICTFTNSEIPIANTGNLTVIKIVNGTDKSFTFNGTAPFNGFNLSNGQSNVQNNLTPGTFTIAEAIDPAYSLDSIDCVGNAAAEMVTLATGQVIVDVGATENVVCTYTNSEIQQAPGSLTVIKTVIGPDKDFAFSGTAPFGNFSLSNGQSNVQNNLAPGTFSISETVDPAYALASINCVGNAAPEFVALGAGLVSVDVGSNENVVCTYINRLDPDDPRMEEETKRFIHRRVDNLLTHGPDRARMLRRLSERDHKSSKDTGSIKFAGRSHNASSVEGLGQQFIRDNNPTAVPGGVSAFGFNRGYRGYASGRSGLGDTARDMATPVDDVLDGHQARNPLFDAIAGQAASLAQGRSAFKFGTSLSALRENASQQEAQKQRKKISNAGLNFAAQPLTNPNVQTTTGLDFWIEGHISRYNDDVGGVKRDGDFRILYVGADYVIRPGFLIGFLAQVDDTKEDLSQPGESGAIEGTGWMVGPYLGWKVLDNLFFDARAAWGQSDNDIWLQDPINGLRSGSFDTDRWLATASLTGNDYYGAWRVSPQLMLAYGHEEYDAYRNSIGQLINGGEASIGRLTGTLEIGYRMMTPRGTRIEPHASLSGIWNFDSDDLVINGALVNTNDSRGRVEAGVLVTPPRGWSFRAAANYDGIGGDDFESYGGSLWLNIPLN